MIEHRLIEKMIDIIKQKTVDIRESGNIDPGFIDTAVDFIKIYADKTHHGKEEDILFRDCLKKDMSDTDTKIMNELIEEHAYGRKIVAELVEAKEKYVTGDNVIDTIIDKLTALAEFYPGHIEKEDTIFFPNSEKYFTEAELNNMLVEFRKFDETMIHEKYKSAVAQYTD